MRNKITWQELKFPPINLWSIWPTKEMAAIHAENQDKTLWSADLNKELTYEK